ncbi:polar amino acid transport system substrate-binding protein [Pseudorhizobium tarimense]|uniref:Polar amino acid transport system substrate-binding protein n=1 Tax=Pseudorhizobium tarimense TaxID=1079109 RepID=A0ABV2H7Y0_9HYPH|nr:hypothetical protein [Pseudorhizobium tarimense]MCJ8519354.1 hypothetical protein [Pseudorhizobium tarimense]
MTDISLEDAESYLVGTHRADYTEALLERLGFPLIDVSADFETNVRKLIEKRIVLMPMSEGIFADMLAKRAQIREVATLDLQPLGFACNPTLSDALIAKMQAVLDRLVASGEQDRILSSYGIVQPK